MIDQWTPRVVYQHGSTTRVRAGVEHHGATVISAPGDGTHVEWRSIHFTPGAIWSPDLVQPSLAILKLPVKHSA